MKPFEIEKIIQKIEKIIQKIEKIIQHIEKKKYLPKETGISTSLPSNPIHFTGVTIAAVPDPNISIIRPSSTALITWAIVYFSSLTVMLYFSLANCIMESRVTPICVHVK